MSLNDDSFGEKDSDGWYIIHVTENVKQEILKNQENSKKYIELFDRVMEIFTNLTLKKS